MFKKCSLLQQLSYIPLFLALQIHILLVFPLKKNPNTEVYYHLFTYALEIGTLLVSRGDC